jgi:hypothetical protein
MAGGEKAVVKRIDMNNTPAIFENFDIHRIYDEKTETWYFSVVDIIRALLQQPDFQAARNYWKVLKNRLNKEGSETVTNCNRLKLPAEDEPTKKQQTAIETSAQEVLDARTKFPTSTLADLYDPLTMPPELVKVHQALDRAVDAAYACTEPGRSGKNTFKTEAERVAFLFERYQQLSAPLIPEEPTKVEKVRRGKAK